MLRLPKAAILAVSGTLAMAGTAMAFDGPNIGLLVDATLPGMQGAGCQVGGCTADSLLPVPFGGSVTLPFDFGVTSSNGDTYQITGTIGNSVNADGTAIYHTYLFMVTLTGAANGQTSSGAPDTLALHVFARASRRSGNWTGYSQLQGNFSAGFNTASQVGVRTTFTANASSRSVSIAPVSPASAIAQSTFSKTASTAIPAGSLPILFEDVFTIAIQQGTRVGSSLYLSSYSVRPSVQVYSSVLPTARTTVPGSPVTAFATILNATSPGADGQPDVSGRRGIAASADGAAEDRAGDESGVAERCGLAVSKGVPGTFQFQTTDPATNLPTGTADTPVDIAPGQSQSFVFAVTPSATFSLAMPILMSCANTMPAPTALGLNTLLLTSSPERIPDMISISATPAGDGNLDVSGPNGIGAMAVATINIGPAGRVTFAPTTTPFGETASTLPLSLTLCPTNADGACLVPPAPSVALDVSPNQTLTFSVFAAGQGQAIAYNPAFYRVFFRALLDGLPVGETSAAIRMQ